MDYSIRITDTAKDDLKRIAWDEKDKSSSSDKVSKLITKLKKECSKIVPKEGSVPDDRFMKSLGYRFITFKDYQIVYSFNPKDMIVDIMAVLGNKIAL